jgi:hypothetical protein
MAIIIDLAEYRAKRKELNYPIEREMRLRDEARIQKAHELGLALFELDADEYQE